MKTFKIPFTQGQAKNILSKDDFRPAMKGVFFDNTNGLFVLTNAHALSMIEIDMEEMFDTDFIIPIEALPTNKKDSEISDYTFEDGKIIKIGAVGSRSEFLPIDEKYPAYNSVIPSKNSSAEIPHISFNMGLIGSVSNFLKFVDPKNQISNFYFHGTNKAVKFKCKTSAYNVSGLIMPCLFEAN